MNGLVANGGLLGAGRGGRRVDNDGVVPPSLPLFLFIDKGNRKQGRDDPAPKPLVDHPFSVDYSNTVSYCMSKRKVVEAKVGEG